MSKIKTKETVENTIKTLDKGVIITQKTKEKLVNLKKKSENSVTTDESNVNEYAQNKMISNNKKVIGGTRKIIRNRKKAIEDTKTNISKIKTKFKDIKGKLAERKTIKKAKKKIKAGGKTNVKDAKKIARETTKASRKAAMITREAARRTAKSIKRAIKVVIKTVKAFIMAAKFLIMCIFSFGTVILFIIILMCLIGLLISSIFGIFFAGEGDGEMNMKTAIAKCNQEFSDKIEQIKAENSYEEYRLDGDISAWKNVLIVYTVSETENGQEVFTMNEEKIEKFVQIFWDMNEISSQVKREIVTEQGVSEDEEPKEVVKKVLRVTVTPKTAEDMISKYSFNYSQRAKLKELSSPEYDSLWNSAIYGLSSGDYMTWRQRGAPWSNVKMGNANVTIGDVGCLVTSIAILIQKSGVKTDIQPFNPGTFVEALNKNDGLADTGDLRYVAVGKAVPNFNYIGNVNLRGKTREEKLITIKQYFNMGYYLTLEVKGATPGNQHWVAIIGINGNNVVMVDPMSDHTDLWSAYEWTNTTQFNYFKAN